MEAITKAVGVRDACHCPSVRRRRRGERTGDESHLRCERSAAGVPLVKPSPADRPLLPPFIARRNRLFCWSKVLVGLWNGAETRRTRPATQCVPEGPVCSLFAYASVDTPGLCSSE